MKFIKFEVLVYKKEDDSTKVDWKTLGIAAPEDEEEEVDWQTRYFNLLTLEDTIMNIYMQREEEEDRTVIEFIDGITIIVKGHFEDIVGELSNDPK